MKKLIAVAVIVMAVGTAHADQVVDRWGDTVVDRWGTPVETDFLGNIYAEGGIIPIEPDEPLYPSGGGMEIQPEEPLYERNGILPLNR